MFTPSYALVSTWFGCAYRSSLRARLQAGRKKFKIISKKSFLPQNILLKKDIITFRISVVSEDVEVFGADEECVKFVSAYVSD